MSPLIEPPVEPVSPADPTTGSKTAEMTVSPFNLKTAELAVSPFNPSAEPEIVEFNENSVDEEGSAQVIFWAVNIFK